MIHVRWSRPLNSVSWSTLATSHGHAAHVPGALKSLASEDGDVRSAAYWQLDNSVVLQSDLSESAFYVVPFVIDLLRELPIPARALIYKLLFELANGSALDTVTVRLPNGTDIALEEATHREVAKGLDLYFRDVHSDDLATSYGALELLSVLDLEQDVVKARLKADVGMTSDEPLKSRLSAILEELEAPE